MEEYCSWEYLLLVMLVKSLHVIYEKFWQRGGFNFFQESYNDNALSEEANQSLANLPAFGNGGHVSINNKSN